MFSKELIADIRKEVELHLQNTEGIQPSIGEDGEKTIEENLEVMLHSLWLKAMGA